jgi:hypothetical protein
MPANGDTGRSGPLRQTFSPVPGIRRNGAQRVYSGVDAVKAADVVMRDQSNREKWPYMHVYPPVNAEPVHVIGSVETPALGAQVIVLEYPVPSGFRFYLRGIIQTYEGGSFYSGQALWTIDRNTPVGVPNFQAQPEQGLIAVPVQVGSYHPWTVDEFARAYEFEALDIVRSKATNVSLGVGSPNFFTSGFFGYLVPDVGQR